MPVRLISPSPEALPLIARKILLTFKGRRIFAFSGNMGAGKTTLIQHLCNQLGVEDFTASPTFSLVNEYRSAADEAVYHFDFYRIEHIKEVYDMGYEEYFFSGNYCFIEWPEKISELLPPDCVYIRIEELSSPGSRSFEFDTDV